MKCIVQKNDEIAKIIKSTVQEYLPDVEVFLFGSRAKNNASTESDYDILLIIRTELSPREKLPLRTKVRKSLLEIGIRSDILIQSRLEVKRKKNLPGHIIRHILNEAIQI
jgi:predicted nucleotidyltransferase